MKKNFSNKNGISHHTASLKHQNILNITTTFTNHPLTLQQLTLKSISPSYRKRCGSKPENAYGMASSPKDAKNRVSYKPEVQTYKIESKIPISMTIRNSYKPLKSSKFTNNDVKLTTSEINKSKKIGNTPINQVKKRVLSKADSPNKNIPQLFKLIQCSSRKIMKKSSSELSQKVEKVKNSNKKIHKCEISRNIEENTLTTCYGTYGTELKENIDPKVAKLNFVNFNGYCDDESDDSDIITTSNLSVSSKNCESQFFLGLPENYEMFATNLPNLTGPENYIDRDIEDFDEFKSLIKTTKYIFKPNILKKNILM